MTATWSQGEYQEIAALAMRNRRILEQSGQAVRKDLAHSASASQDCDAKRFIIDCYRIIHGEDKTDEELLDQFRKDAKQQATAADVVGLVAEIVWQRKILTDRIRRLEARIIQLGPPR